MKIHERSKWLTEDQQNKQRLKMRIRMIILIAAVLSFAGFIALYGKLPEQLPSHWNFNGEIDDYMSKQAFIAFMFMPIGLYLMMELLPKIDPKKKAYDQHYKAYGYFELFMVLFVTGMQWLSIGAALGMNISVSKVVLYGLGLMLLLLGNFMPQIRPNYFFGIKTPWTLADEQVWKKTHRLGGYIYSFAGLTIILANFALPSFFSAYGVFGLIMATFLPVGYSYWLFKKLHP